MKTQLTQAHIASAMVLLEEAERPVRILSHLGWPASIREQFLADGCKKMPQVSYPEFDAGQVCAITNKLVQQFSPFEKDPVADWILRLAKDVESGALMLAATGTPEFLQHSRTLYGLPKDALPDENTTCLGLANQFINASATFANFDLGAPAPACNLAETVAEEMRRAVNKMFGDIAPTVEVVEELSANALAGPNRIRIRKAAHFTDLDVKSLIEHEAYIHVGTSLNGLAQPHLPVLAYSHPASTCTQEGLAVFAEFISGNWELDRLRRLADRVFAVQMAVDGADFLDVFGFFKQRGISNEQAFENSRRVFRGGVLTGGAPFTKDIVYLDGLLRVHSFLRSIVISGRADLLQLLFCGKLDIEDIPALAVLTEMGLCKAPQFLPPWAKDMRYLVSHLVYTTFLNNAYQSKLNEHYNQIINTSPIVAD
ncbi:flavohemoglobin expression-modulating QEGLA motif protein [Planctobacterium marinum]|uniref:DUF1704 domain-containing protein n=1 Tax=Planctobacterium marinum TaxID=1631968 RepID=A0AA48KQV4_9ALTE|nr:hypothetical protein MACH26_03250 [Planctobacterium marinum]